MRPDPDDNPASEPDTTSSAGTSRSNGHTGTEEPQADDSAGAPQRPAGPIYPIWLKLVGVLVVLGSIGLLTVVYLSTSDNGGDGGNGSGSSPAVATEGIVSVTPPQGSQALQQDTVRVVLEPGWNGQLTIAGEPIPEDNLRRSDPSRQDSEGQGQGLEDVLEFAPGPDQALEALPTGRICASVSVWQRVTGPEGSTSDMSWCFDVL